MGFVNDSLDDGRRIKCWTLADDFSHECVDIAVDLDVSGHFVTRISDRAVVLGCYPLEARTDYDPEFTRRAFISWAGSHSFHHILIRPGRPTADCGTSVRQGPQSCIAIALPMQLKPQPPRKSTNPENRTSAIWRGAAGKGQVNLAIMRSLFGDASCTPLFARMCV